MLILFGIRPIDAKQSMPTKQELIAALTAPGSPFELEEAEILGIPWRIYKNAPASLAGYLTELKDKGDEPFLIYEDELYSAAETARLAAGLTVWLADRGVGKGDRIAIGMRNYPEYPVAFWATQGLGAISVLLNAFWNGAELHYAVEDSGASVLILDAERYADLEPHIGDMDLKAVIVVRGNMALPTGLVAWEQLRDALPQDPALPMVEIEPEDDATILYTSGTTGLPKGAIGSHRNHITNIMNTLLQGAVGQMLTLAAAPDAEAPQPIATPKSLQTFPYFHIAGVTGMCLAAAAGACSVLMYKWDAAKALDLIETHGITGASGVPTVVRDLLTTAAEQGRALDTLSAMPSGGAPVPPDLIHKIRDQFNSSVMPGNGYGLTETSSAVVTNGGEEYFDYPDSVGRPVVTADVRFVDPDDGHICDVGEIGEFCVRGPNVIRGYWNREEATRESFRDGWFHSGDLGYMSDEGFVYIVDRLKDIVIRAGENIYSAEVEAVIYEHESVADNAVVGIPNKTLGEEVACVVKLKPGAILTAEELQAFASVRLASFKVPSKILFTDVEIPRTATGKVLKRQMRDDIIGKE
jgi:long-chain acyl-CoA synthetase